MDIEVLKRETSLAIGLVILLLGSMTIATGTYPPMVVVESGSMMHDPEQGSVGAIDPGDLVLVMSVVPGKGGQSFIPEVEGKVRSLREAIDFQIENGGRETKLMIDGGIKDHNAALVAGWGIDIAVVGSGLINKRASIGENLVSITNNLEI